MAKTITIYSTTDCGSCRMVKKYLQSKDMTYQEVNLDEHPELRQQVIEMSGAMTVPITVVANAGHDDTKDIIVGWNPGRIASALAA